MIGCHSVIDSPDRVSLVTPPTTTIRKISAQTPNNHTATARKSAVLFPIAVADVASAAVGRNNTVLPRLSLLSARWAAPQQAASAAKIPMLTPAAGEKSDGG